MEIKNRFDGFLPMVIDLETSGCIPATDALLELAAVLVNFDENDNCALASYMPAILNLLQAPAGS